MTKHTPTPTDNQIVLRGNDARKIQARAEMCLRTGIGAVMYLAHSNFVRRGNLPDGRLAYSTVDLINVLADYDNEPRKSWEKVKSRLVKDDKDMSPELGHISLPLWDDKSGRSRATDVITWEGLYILVFELHSELSNRLRHEIAREEGQYPEEYRAQIRAELQKEVGWAGTAIHLQLKDTYAPDEFDEPKGVAGDYWK